MPIISNTIPNLINGVTQQPQALRLPTQCDSQVNGYSSVVNGLGPRPGTVHSARISGLSVDNAKLHTINRDPTEQYHVVINDEDVRVFDLDGNEKTVINEGGTALAYLDTATPKDDVKCVTVADYTFVLNKKKVVAKTTKTSPAKVEEGLFWIKQGGYGLDYKVIVDGNVYTYTTQDGSDPSHSTDIATENIAKELYNAMVAGALGSSTYTVNRYGSTIRVRRNSGTFSSFYSNDGLGDTAISTIKDRVQRFSELPNKAPNGFSVEVTGDQSSSFDNYYVEFEPTGGAGGTGTWKEVVKPDLEVELDKTTLPHALIRTGTNEFTFKAIDWEERKVGDDDSNPMPSFLGRTISDIFFHRNRLGFTSNESIIMSRTGDFFNLFRGTTTTVLDDDPIDVGVSHTKVSLIEHAVPFNETLLLFSGQTQFQLGRADVLTPNTISVNQTTEYEAATAVKPIGVGRFIYFAVNRGIYTSIREYFVDPETEGLDAVDITGHVPQFIPNGAYLLTASGTEDVIVVLTEEAPNELYVNNFYWASNEKMQSAWHKWTLSASAEIKHAQFIESTLYLIVKRDDGLVHFEKMNLEPKRTEPNWTFDVRLDRKITDADFYALLYDPIADVTRITLPYRLYGTPTTIVTPGGNAAPGTVIAVEDSGVLGGRTWIDLLGDQTSESFIVGEAFEFRYTFSRFYIREAADEEGETVVDSGRLQLRRLALQYADSGYFRVEVRPRNRPSYAYPFTARILGSSKNVLAEESLETGRFMIPIMARNYDVEIDIVNDTPLPCYILSAEWEGFYQSRAQRL